MPILKILYSLFPKLSKKQEKFDFIIPDGYTLEKLEGFDGKILKPIKWFSKQFVVNTTYVYQMSNEKITGNGFKTGFTLNIIALIKQKTNLLPSEYALNYIKEYSLKGSVVSNDEQTIISNSNGPIVRSGFQIDEVITFNGLPIKCRLGISVYAIDSLDIMAIMTFGCPIEDWSNLESTYSTICSKIAIIGDNFGG